MKKIIALSAVAFLSTAVYANADLQSQIDKLNKKLTSLQKKVSRVNAQSAKDNIKFDVDFRTSYDRLEYKTAANNTYSNNALYSNRLWLNMGYAPQEDLLFKGQLSFNKAFGASYGQQGSGFGFDTFDWVINENLTNDYLKVREAYWLWMPTTGDIGWTVSVGRRPATNGYLVNLRDDDKAKSPMGHVINMEFDGASASMQLDKYVSGMYVKLCLGRGLTNATGWASQATFYTSPNNGSNPAAANLPNYIEDPSKNLDNVDMVGVIFKPYDDGQYSVMTKYYRGFNVPGMQMTTNQPYSSDGTPNGAYDINSPMANLVSFGDMDGAAISAKVEGIGDEISDFLDETIIFASLAWSQTRPNTGQAMLGSLDKETGTSYWLGTQMPNLMGGKFGLEYNHGSENWRPFTYGEDTMIGSKMAVRGNAYEAYITQPLGKAFSMQVRYTYLDYDYTGSSAFFGDGGAAYKIDSPQAIGMNAVETAQDLRVYFRYRY